MYISRCGGIGTPVGSGSAQCMCAEQQPLACPVAGASRLVENGMHKHCSENTEGLPTFSNRMAGAENLIVEVSKTYQQVPTEATETEGGLM